MRQCEKCGSILFLVDETVTFLEIDGEAEKEMGEPVFQSKLSEMYSAEYIQGLSAS